MPKSSTFIFTKKEISLREKLNGIESTFFILEGKNLWNWNSRKFFASACKWVTGPVMYFMSPTKVVPCSALCSYSRDYFIVSIECNNSIAVNVSHNLQGTPFFNGKLILHDPPGMGNGNRGLARPFNPGNVLANTSNNGGGFLMTSPPSKLGAIPKKMPSPAAQVHIQSLFRNWRFILVKMPYPASPI